MARAKKTKRRLTIIEKVVGALKEPEIYQIIKARDKPEHQLRQMIYVYLRQALEKIIAAERPSLAIDTLKSKADDALLWDGDARTVINSLQFLGVQHRPDFEIRIENCRIGIEVKRGESGSDIRAGLGQAIVYCQHYDFVIYLFADTSKDSKILKSLPGAQEAELLISLWDNYNIRFEVVKGA